jgi:CheY-like chemotaxis protein
VVDDNPEARLVLKHQLEAQGHSVVGQAENLKGTLEAYRRLRPHLVMLDLSLEKEDGLTVLKALRDEDPGATVFILSANEMKRVREAALAAGASNFLSKPLDVDGFEAILSSMQWR